MTEALRLTPVPIATLAPFMEACAAHPSADAAEVASFAGYSPATAKRALPSLETLGIVKRTTTECTALQ